MDSSDRQLAMAYKIEGKWVMLDADRLHEVRRAIKMHKKELGSLLGTSRNQIDRLESGKAWLSLEQAQRLYGFMCGNPSIFKRVDG